MGFHMLISIIIPCRYEKDDIEGLLKDIADQKISFNTEAIRITNVSPPSKARNDGAKKAKGEILVFIDCDIRPGNEHFLTNLVGPLLEEENIGITCASLRASPDSSKFQIRYAREVPHSESLIADKLTDVFVASSACCAVPRNIFFRVGGFNEDIIRGEDSLLSYQLKEAGYRVVLAPNTWCYHPQPANLVQLIRMQLKIGNGVAFVDVFHPELNIDVHPKGIAYTSEKKSAFERLVRFVSSGLQAICKIRILLVLAKFFYALGYLQGLLRYTVFKCRK